MKKRILFAAPVAILGSFLMASSRLEAAPSKYYIQHFLTPDKNDYRNICVDEHTWNEGHIIHGDNWIGYC